MSAVAAPAEIDEIVARCRAAFEFAESVRWKSYDPFDALLAPFAESIQSKSALLARVIVQGGRRSGPVLRRLSRMKPHEEAKAFADFLAASSALVRLTGGEWAARFQLDLTNRLERLSIELPHGEAWGLSFPYASRFVSVPRHTPNAYTTICCVEALLDVAEHCSDDRPLDLALAGARAISADLGIVQDGGRSWFRYWPTDDTCIVNVQALIAGCFQRLGCLMTDGNLSAQAELAAEVVLASQRSDGSFPYCADRRGQFIDAFHTGFVLEGLTRFRLHRPAYDGSRVTDCVERGMEFLRARLIDPSHLPRKSPGGPVARDGQNVGQLIQTLAVCGDTDDRRLAADLWRRWTSPVSSGGLPAGDGRGRMMSLRWDVGPTVLAGARLALALTDDR